MTDELEATAVRAIKASTPDAFAPGFEDRVMARLGREQKDASALFFRTVRRTIPVALATAAALMIYVLSSTSRSEGSVAERLLGLTPVTFASAYGIDVEQ